jgi:hypothetical protein
MDRSFRPQRWLDRNVDAPREHALNIVSISV